MESWKRRKKKKRQREIIIQWKELIFFFSILVALQVLCNLEFVFHLTLKVKKKINSLTQPTLGFLIHLLDNLPISGTQFEGYYPHFTGEELGTEQGKRKSLWQLRGPESATHRPVQGFCFHFCI